MSVLDVEAREQQRLLVKSVEWNFRCSDCPGLYLHPDRRICGSHRPGREVRPSPADDDDDVVANRPLGSASASTPGVHASPADAGLQPELPARLWTTAADGSAAAHFFPESGDPEVLII